MTSVAAILRANLAGDITIIVPAGANHQGPTPPEAPAKAAILFRQAGGSAQQLMVYDINNSLDTGVAGPVTMYLKSAVDPNNSNQRIISSNDGSSVTLVTGTPYEVHVSSETDLDIGDYIVSDKFLMIAPGGTGSNESNIELQDSEVFVYDGDAAAGESMIAAVDMSSYFGTGGSRANLVVGSRFKEFDLKAQEFSPGNSSEHVEFNALSGTNTYTLSLDSNSASGINAGDDFRLTATLTYCLSAMFIRTDDGAGAPTYGAGENYDSANAFIVSAGLSNAARATLGNRHLTVSYPQNLRAREVVPSAREVTSMAITDAAVATNNTTIVAPMCAAGAWAAFTGAPQNRNNVRHIVYYGTTKAAVLAKIDADFAQATPANPGAGNVSNARQSALGGLSSEVPNGNAVARSVVSAPGNGDNNNVATHTLLSSKLYARKDSSFQVFMASVSAMVTRLPNENQDRFLIANQTLSTTGSNTSTSSNSLSVHQDIVVNVFTSDGVSSAFNAIDGKLDAVAPSNGTPRRFRYELQEDGSNAAALLTKVQSQGMRMSSAAITFNANNNADSKFKLESSKVTTTGLSSPVSAAELASGQVLSDSAADAVVSAANASYTVPTFTLSANVAGPARPGSYKATPTGNSVDMDHQGGATPGAASFSNTNLVGGTGNTVVARPSKLTCEWSGTSAAGESVIVFKVGDNKDSYWPHSEGSLDNVAANWSLQGAAGIEGLIGAAAQAAVPAALRVGPFAASYNAMDANNRYLVYTKTINANTTYSAFSPKLRINANVAVTRTLGGALNIGADANGNISGNEQSSADAAKTVVHLEKAAKPSGAVMEYAAAGYGSGNGIKLSTTRSGTVADDGFTFASSADESRWADAYANNIGWSAGIAEGAGGKFETDIMGSSTISGGALSGGTTHKGRWYVRNYLFVNGQQLSAGTDASNYVVQHSDTFDFSNSARDSFNGSNVIDPNDGNGVSIVGNSADPTKDDKLTIKLKALTASSNGQGSGNAPFVNSEKVLVWVYKVDANGAVVEGTNAPTFTDADLLDGQAAANKIFNWCGENQLGKIKIDVSGSQAQTLDLLAEHGSDYKLAALRYSVDPNGMPPAFYQPAMSAERAAAAADKGNKYIVSRTLDSLFNNGSNSHSITEICTAQDSGLDAVTSVAQLGSAGLSKNNTGSTLTFNVETAGRKLASVFFIFDVSNLRNDASGNVNLPGDAGTANNPSSWAAQPVLKITHLGDKASGRLTTNIYESQTNPNGTVSVTGGLGDYVAELDLVQAADGNASLTITWKTGQNGLPTVQLVGGAAVGVTSQGEMAVAFNPNL